MIYFVMVKGLKFAGWMKNLNRNSVRNKIGGYLCCTGGTLIWIERYWKILTGNIVGCQDNEAIMEDDF